MLRHGQSPKLHYQKLAAQITSLEAQLAARDVQIAELVKEPKAFEETNVLGERRIAKAVTATENQAANAKSAHVELAASETQLAAREKELKTANAEVARLKGELAKMSKLEAARAAEVAKLEAVRAAEVAKLQAARAVDKSKLDAARAAEVAKLEAARGAEVAKLEAARAAEVAKLVAARAAEVFELKEELVRSTALVNSIEENCEEAMRGMEAQHEAAIDNAKAQLEKVIEKLNEQSADVFPKSVPKGRSSDAFEQLSEGAQRTARHCDIEYACWFVQFREWRVQDSITVMAKQAVMSDRFVS